MKCEKCPIIHMLFDKKYYLCAVFARSQKESDDKFGNVQITIRI